MTIPIHCRFALITSVLFVSAMTRVSDSLAISPFSQPYAYPDKFHEFRVESREYDQSSGNTDDDNTNNPYNPPALQDFPEPPEAPALQSIPTPIVQRHPVIQSVPRLPVVQSVPVAPAMPNVPAGPSISMQKPHFPGVPSIPAQQGVPRPPSIPYSPDSQEGGGQGGFENDYGDGYNVKGNDAGFGQGFSGY